MANNIIVQFSETEFTDLLKSCISDSLKENAINQEKAVDKHLSIKEASVFLNLAPQTLYGFTSNRTIPFIKKGKRLYFKKSDLEVWLNDGRKDSLKEIEQKSKHQIKGGKHE